MRDKPALKFHLQVSRLVAAMLLVALPLAACSSGDGDSGAKDPTSEAPVPLPDKDDALADLLPEDIRDAGAVRVASNAPFPPFEMFVTEGSKEFTGFDYDLGQAMGAKLGIEFKFEQTPFDGIIPGLQAEKFDVVMAALSATAKRAETVSFVTYFESGGGLLVKKGNPENIKSALDLCGKAATTQSGSQWVDWLEAQSTACTDAGEPAIEISALPQASDCHLAVTSGKAVVAVGDQPAGAYVAATTNGGDTFEMVDLVDNPGGYDSQPGGIAVNKSDTELLGALQQTVQALMDDGTYGELLDKYGISSIAIDQSETVE